MKSDLPVFSDCCDRRVLADAIDFFPDFADLRECVDACPRDWRREWMDDLSVSMLGAWGMGTTMTLVG